MHRKPASVADIVSGGPEMSAIERDEDGAIFKSREWVRGHECSGAATDFGHGWYRWDNEVNRQSWGLGMVDGGAKTAPPTHTTTPGTGRTAVAFPMAIVGGSITASVCIASLPPLLPLLSAAIDIPLADEKNKKPNGDQCTRDNNTCNSSRGDPVVAASTGTIGSTGTARAARARVRRRHVANSA